MNTENLKMVECLYQEEVDVIAIFSDNEQKYFALLYDQIDFYNEYVMVPISEEDIVKVKDNKLSIREIIVNAKNLYQIFVGDRISYGEEITLDKLEPEYLPEEGVMLYYEP